MVNWLNTSSILAFALVLVSSCSSSSKEEKSILNTKDNSFSTQVSIQEIQGYTQGSTFQIKTSDDSLLLSTYEIESLFTGFDAELSGYMEESLISKVNASSKGMKIPENAYFTHCFNKSLEVFKTTNGAFDPSVFPMVKAWGFFKDSNLVLSQQEVDSCLQFISFEPNKLYRFTGDSLLKKDTRFCFDFNAIAQGYSVDVVADFLDAKGQTNYFIEIGGELKTKGVNNEGKPWFIGIDVPLENNDGLNKRSLENAIAVDNKALATSGNYRKYYVVDGRKYSHTIDPKTGYSVKHNLLSATVMADDCASADAYATAFMVMGKDATMEFVANHPELNLEVYLLFQNEEGLLERAYTSGIASCLQY
ncbi:thiamine biosynthesis lipoprotein [Lishizhenia tianjinensis]|uniref:FAD:protein FMN transferase n=1 Tax=Lishizhenia tianjinensis TaxID=477690 RepID=A0A1I6YKD3_9FLAO|nr:FAD:protein FMN transferase [Lishizhenia tianjinensis]SFT50943.1 thiamine biosynthesis lipoprotein [Lishizhenia tianjinensis]